MSAPANTAAPHPMQAAYDAEMARPRYEACNLSVIGWAVTYAAPPTLNERGMNSSLRFPILVPGEWLDHAAHEPLCMRVAALLNADQPLAVQS